MNTQFLMPVAMSVLVVLLFCFVIHWRASRDQRIFGTLRNQLRSISGVRSVYCLREQTIWLGFTVWVVVDELRPAVEDAVRTAEKLTREEVECRLTFHVVQSGRLFIVQSDRGEAGLDGIPKVHCLYRRDASPFDGSNAPDIWDMTARAKRIR